MTILFITNNQNIDKDEAYGWFANYCDQQTDLILKHSITDAKSFLMTSIIEVKKQKHLDFIITDWKFNLENAKELLNWIRNSSEMYSSFNFQFNSIPVLLIEDPDHSLSAIEEGFDGIVRGFPDEYLRLKMSVKSAIKDWRLQLAKDLDLIGLDPETNKIYTNHRKAFISYYRLKVLSRKFVDDKSKRLNYIWTSHSSSQLEYANDSFSSMISKTYRNPRTYSEKDIHLFFKQNPTIVKGEYYLSGTNKEELIYEPHLYKNGTRKYDEPDFLNKPHNYSLRNPEVFEIKLQTQKLIRNDSDRFLSKARKSFAQAKRYKDYMNSTDPRHQAYVLKYFGQIYSQYQITLLMGSRSEKEANLDLIDRLKSDFEFEDINLTTYEELLHRHVKLCERLDEFRIF